MNVSQLNICFLLLYEIIFIIENKKGNKKKKIRKQFNNYNTIDDTQFDGSRKNPNV